MKIENITLTNFMGIKGRLSLDLPHIAAIIGPNGMGKTTVLNSIRYALTGAEPEGDIINTDSEQCRVSITLKDAADGQMYTFERMKDRKKPSKCTINGKFTTQKSMNEKMEDIIGIPLEKIKVLSSSEIVASMKPQEFSSFILDYIPEKLKFEDVVKFVPDMTMGMSEIMEAYLPAEDIDMSVINEFDGVCRFNRKDVKDQLERKRALYETKPQEAPLGDAEDIKKQIAELQNRDAAYKVYLAQKSSYDKANDALKKHEDMLKDLETQIKGISATRPDIDYYARLKNEEASIRDTIKNQTIAISSAQGALRQLEVSLDNLNNPVCPLSEKIICHQDKTAAKEDLTESITSTKEGINAMQAELTKAEERLAANEKAKKEYQDNFTLYDRKITLSKQYKSLDANKPEVPAKPDEIAKPDDGTAMADLNRQLKAHADYEEGLQLSREISGLEASLKDYEALVKALAEKGPVRTGIISSYLKVFEDLCNERSKKVRPEINFKFISQDGVVVLMDNGKDSKLPYASLSGGEKAYMLFIIMDMLNSLCGTNILMLDELSVVDKKCFDALLDIASAYAGDYDHILLAAVDHDDTVNSVESRSIPFLSLEAEYGMEKIAV